MLRKISILLIMAMFFVSCASVKQSKPFEVKNNIILQDGFKLGLASLQHKYKIKLAPKTDLTISQIDYELRIPNFKEKIRGTFEIEKPISLNKAFGEQEVNVLSESIGYLSVCDHFNAMFASEKDVFSMRMDLYFYSGTTKYEMKDIEVKFDNSNLWAQLRNRIIEKGCNVARIIDILKEIWKF